MSRNAGRRSHRVQRLDALRPRVEQATRELRLLHHQGVRPSTVGVRTALFTGNPYKRPPIARISAPRGLNLQIYLLALFEAQCRKRTGLAGVCPLPISDDGPLDFSWSGLVVSAARENTRAKAPVTSSQNRVRQIRSSLKRLDDEGLILRNVGDPKNPYPLMLLNEASAKRAERFDYAVPAEHEGPRTMIQVPVQFFTNGWVYLLTDSEIRMYFIFRHLAGRFPEAHYKRGIYCTDRDREWLYVISRDVYEAHLMLTRFGLLERIANPSRHADGKVVNFDAYLDEGGVVSPHRFRVEPHRALMAKPIPRIRRALLNYPTGYPGSDES